MTQSCSSRRVCLLTVDYWQCECVLFTVTKRSIENGRQVPSLCTNNLLLNRRTSRGSLEPELWMIKWTVRVEFDSTLFTTATLIKLRNSESSAEDKCYSRPSKSLYCPCVYRTPLKVLWLISFPSRWTSNWPSPVRSSRCCWSADWATTSSSWDRPQRWNSSSGHCSGRWCSGSGCSSTDIGCWRSRSWGCWSSWTYSKSCLAHSDRYYLVGLHLMHSNWLDYC